MLHPRAWVPVRLTFPLQLSVAACPETLRTMTNPLSPCQPHEIPSEFPAPDVSLVQSLLLQRQEPANGRPSSHSAFLAISFSFSLCFHSNKVKIIVLDSTISKLIIPLKSIQWTSFFLSCPPLSPFPSSFSSSSFLSRA